MSAYTPGPWKVSHTEHTDGLDSRIHYWTVYPVGDPRDVIVGLPMAVTEQANKRTEANAHLIAAAPALLEALEEITASAGGCCTWVETREKARAAIALAKGEQS